jgi:hypothetical protein
MRTKTVKRYYCDHCSKGGFKEPSMRQHELGCTRNPDRVCYLCEMRRNYRELTIQAKARSTPDKFSDDARTINGAKELSELSDMVDGCPACLLAVLRQSNVMAFEHFDYKTNLDAWHREQQPFMSYQ